MVRDSLDATAAAEWLRQSADILTRITDGLARTKERAPKRGEALNRSRRISRKTGPRKSPTAK
jgi:hypothetical protein